jgi:hypothetical protein
MKLLPVAVLFLCVIPVFADSIDDAEAKRRGVSVELIAKDRELAAANAKIMELQAQITKANAKIVELQAQITKLNGQIATSASSTPAGWPVKMTDVAVPGKNYAPLAATYSEAAKDAVARMSYHAATVVGATGQSSGDFEDIAPDGGVLIGLRVGQAGLRGGIITAVQPIFLTPKGVVMGTIHGNPATGMVTDLVAKEGYVVEGIGLMGGTNLSAVELTFLRMTPSGLDPKDSYTSARVGSNNPNMNMGGNSAAIGIAGRTNDRDSVGIALVFVPNQSGVLAAKH